MKSSQIKKPSEFTFIEFVMCVAFVMTFSIMSAVMLRAVKQSNERGDPWAAIQDKLGETEKPIAQCVASGDCLGANGGSGRRIDMSLMAPESIPCLESACVSGESNGTRVEVRVSRSGRVLARIDIAGTAAAKPRTEWRTWTPQVAANGPEVQWGQKDGAPPPSENGAQAVSKGISGNGSAS